MENQKPRVLVTGASGFLGRNLIPVLLEHGLEVTNLSLQEYGEESVEDIVFDAFKDNLTEALDKKDYDFVIHLAAYASPKLASDYDKTMKLNVEFTRDLLNASRHFPSLKGFFFFSSATTYSDEAERPLKEEAAQAAQEGDYYALSKIRAEEICRDFYKDGVPVRVWRLTNCFGPFQAHEPHPNLIPQIMKEAIVENKITIFNGSHSRDFLYAHDFARLLVNALELSTDYQVLNVATGEPHTVLEIAEIIGDALDIPVEDLQKTLKQPKDLTLDISKFKSMFPNFEFTPFKRALEESLAYYQKVL